MMHRTRSLLTKAGKSVVAEATPKATAAAAATAANDAVAAVAASSHQQPPSYPYKLLHHHTNPELFPYRQPGSIAYAAHHATSAFGAMISLCTSQDARDRFMALTDWKEDGGGDRDEDGTEEGYQGSIINTSILGQSDMGFLKVLTLYQDLNSPLYEDHPKFDARDFLDGCGWALEKFHRTKDELLPKMISAIQEERLGQDNGDESTESNSKDDGDDAGTNKPDDYFLEVAMKDPDSWEHSLISMSTPEVLDTIKMDCLMRIVLGKMAEGDGLSIVEGDQGQADDLKERYARKMKMKTIAEDTKVMNVALLNAQVEEITQIDALAMEVGTGGIDLGAKKDTDAPLEDDSLSLAEALARHQGDTQVVTQLEVLYELQQSSIDDDGKTHARTSVMVAKFEACLGGDPNGDELRWRIASYRPAMEFGYVNTW